MLLADASAVIALLTQEPDAMALADCLERDSNRLYSALSAWEAAAGLCHNYAFSVHDARQIVADFLRDFGFQCVSIGEAEYGVALDAYARYGKGRHPAGLNMGDCFAYACAKTNNARLLFKGGDFAKTDIVAALTI